MFRHCCFFFTLWLAVAGDGNYRLPENVAPEHYKLEILTNLGDNFVFEGKVWIQTICLNDTNKIVLHSKKLNISDDSVTVKDVSSSAVKSEKVTKVEEDKDNDFLIIHLENNLKAENKYEVYISFSGLLEDGLAGYYRSSYVDKKSKEKKWLGVTQFEATSARKAFPCFDEPAMKATFEITIGRKKEYSTLSNMPLVSTQPIKEKEGWFWDKFENSVPMSTYLVAFVVSDFGHKQSEPSKQNNVTFKIWARKDALNQVDFAADVGPKCLEYFEKFFDIPYPLPKQDMVAIPDFSAGAMENWGLITYRESALLFDKKLSSTASQHRIANVVCHELAHQWFGNLVTMKWWTDLWLNEGFATYMASLGVDHLFPQWNSLEEEAVRNLIDVFSFDSLESSHPVSVPIGHPDEIDEIFDTISYKKGSSLLRMMSMFLGEETLKRGVSNYLKKHRFGNAEQDDLWDSLTEEAHKNNVLPANLTVKEIMDTWTVQTGYPIIKVDRDYDKKSAKITQERFLRDTIKTRSSAPCWWVPLSYTNAKELSFNSSMPKSWLSCPKEVKTLEDLPDDKTWLIFNIKMASVIKINYDDKNWKLLSETLNSDDYKKIPTMNRVQLLDDASDLAWTGHLKYEVLFDLLKYLKHEADHMPWHTSLANLNQLKRQLEKTSIYGDFKVYMKDILSPIYGKLGGLVISKENRDKLAVIKHQALIASWACRIGVGNCVQDAKALFEKWQNNPESESPIPTDLRSVVYCTAVREGGEKEWNFIWKQYKKSDVANEKNVILGALGCTQELWLLRRYLEWAVTEDSGIRRQDLSSVFSAVTGRDLGYYISKSFIFNNIKKIHKHLQGNSRRISGLLGGLAHQMNTDDELAELENFIKNNQKYLKEIKKGIDQALENVKLNIQWRKLRFEAVEKALRKYAEAKRADKS